MLVTPTWAELETNGVNCKLEIHLFPINEVRPYSDLVYQGDKHSKCLQPELHHPLPVTMLQWRPSTSKPLNRDARQTLRSVLLTCCVDGTVMLWIETGDGRIRRAESMVVTRWHQDYLLMSLLYLS
ncbi:uncharacterized protein Fot_15029 [Forsythia ovata]|uniref:Uncharacterized protein n=1 Tax=Forsythia ovata TaxID=205694 RepID=A0ABD1W8B7_9LAMI